MDCQPKKRYLNNAACKTIAAQLSQEMREDREGFKTWGCEWFVSSGGVIGKKPGHLIIPGDMEKGMAIIKRLYHPEEAAIIIEHLTDGA